VGNSSRKRGGADAFENEPPFMSKPTVWLGRLLLRGLAAVLILIFMLILARERNVREIFFTFKTGCSGNFWGSDVFSQMLFFGRP
jgi:hypothetical protein